MKCLPHLLFETGAAPRHSLIWLHGLGADGSDFVSMVDELRLPVPVRYLFPDAPKRPVTVNGGFVMRAWYDIVAMDIAARQDAEGIAASQAEIECLIAAEVARGIPPARIFLVGFSQGGAVALHTGLRHADPLGGIVALSTYLPLAETVAAELSSAAKQTPVFMAHGRSDPVVSFGLGQRSAAQLRQLGCTLDWHDYAMPHSLCAAEVRDLERWLTQKLSA